MFGIRRNAPFGLEPPACSGPPATCGVQELGTMRTSMGSERNTENRSVTGAAGFSTSLWGQPVMIVQSQSTTVSGTFRCHGLAMPS
jgi:hypothetical protein